MLSVVWGKLDNNHYNAVVNLKETGVNCLFKSKLSQHIIAFCLVPWQKCSCILQKFQVTEVRYF
jgi:hypothetical protein